jgi:hypothetical protein
MNVDYAFRLLRLDFDPGDDGPDDNPDDDRGGCPDCPSGQCRYDSDDYLE